MHRHHHRRRYREMAERAVDAAMDAATGAADSPPDRATTRVQLEMPPQAMERLQKLKERTEAASYAEVIRNALRLFEALIAEHENGCEFALKQPTGEFIAYKLFV